MRPPSILDSGGAVKNALGVLGDGPFFTLNADAVWCGPLPAGCARPRVGRGANGRTFWR